jgi:hypothetical protein
MIFKKSRSDWVIHEFDKTSGQINKIVKKLFHFDMPVHMLSPSFNKELTVQKGVVKVKDTIHEHTICIIPKKLIDEVLPIVEDEVYNKINLI